MPSSSLINRNDTYLFRLNVFSHECSSNRSFVDEILSGDSTRRKQFVKTDNFSPLLRQQLIDQQFDFFYIKFIKIVIYVFIQ